ncbi:RNA polymerase sigma factor (sigma-70 family) [Bradyrhizobium sp. i1.3.1]
MPANDDLQKAQRFREAALPYLDDVYTLARYLLRDASDAEDAVQECYLRALKHFDSYRGPAMKPWLFAILRNVCNAEYARRAHRPSAIEDTPGAAEQTPIWQESEASPETEVLRRPRCRRHPQADRRARRTVQGNIRAAGDQQPVLS